MMALGAEGVFVGSGIFKSEDPPARARGDRRGHDALAGRRARRGRPRAGLGAGDGQPRELEARATSSCSPSAAGRCAAPIDRRARAAGRIRGARARAARRSARACARCACRRDLDGLDGLVIPGGESTTMTLGDRARGPRASRCASWPRSGVPVLGSCAGLIMLDREHLGADGHARRAQRVRPPDRAASRPTCACAGIAGGPLRGDLHPRAVDRRARRAASRCSPSSTGTRSPRARAACSRSPFTPSSATRSACTGCSSSERAPRPQRAGCAAPARDTRRMRIAVAADERTGVAEALVADARARAGTRCSLHGALGEARARRTGRGPRRRPRATSPRARRAGRRLLLDGHRRVDRRQQGRGVRAALCPDAATAAGRPALERRQRARAQPARHLGGRARRRSSTPGSPTAAQRATRPTDSRERRAPAGDRAGPDVRRRRRGWRASAAKRTIAVLDSSTTRPSRSSRSTCPSTSESVR